MASLLGLAFECAVSALVAGMTLNAVNTIKPPAIAVAVGIHTCFKNELILPPFQKVRFILEDWVQNYCRQV
jgi:hypothetical protein